MSESANAAQAAYWNESAGPTWVQMQDRLDRQLEGLGARAMAALGPQPGWRVIDVGCGCGQTSLALAETVGPSGAVLGVDVSETMLAVARARGRALTQLRFEAADAQVAAFEGGAWDGLYSRFGVLFFEDPTAAFVNLRRALKPAGKLAFVCWRPPAENPWMTMAFAAAADRVPAPSTPPDPLAPGPFAFADADRVRSILTEAGFRDVEARPHDEMVGGAGLEETVELSLRIGPLGGVLRENPALAPEVTGAVRAAFAPHLTSAGVMLPGAVWIVTATRG